MRLKLRALSRYRPRILTLVLLFAIAILIVLANLGDEMRRRVGPIDAPDRARISFDLGEPHHVDPMWGIHGYWNLSYGWPLKWRQYVFLFSPGPGGVLDECFLRRGWRSMRRCGFYCWRYRGPFANGSCVAVAQASVGACARCWPR